MHTMCALLGYTLILHYIRLRMNILLYATCRLNIMATQSKKAKSKALIKYLKARLPSERTKIHCKGCFSPRNTLTVKSHIEKMWLKTDITIIDNGVSISCLFCGESRYLSMSSFSLDVLKADFQDPRNDFFMLLKDDKWNSLIGAESDKDILEVIADQVELNAG